MAESGFCRSCETTASTSSRAAQRPLRRAVQAGGVDRRRGARGDLLRQRQVAGPERARPIAQPGEQPHRLAAQGERHRDERARLRAAEPQLLRARAQRGHVVDEQRPPRQHHLVEQQAVGAERLTLERAAQLGLDPRVAMCAAHRAQLVAVVGHRPAHALVGEGRHQHVGDRRQRRLVLDAGAQHLADARQQLEAAACLRLALEQPLVPEQRRAQQLLAPQPLGDVAAHRHQPRRAAVRLAHRHGQHHQRQHPSGRMHHRQIERRLAVTGGGAQKSRLHPLTRLGGHQLEEAPPQHLARRPPQQPLGAARPGGHHPVARAGP
jgi:hypothetical protein